MERSTTRRHDPERRERIIAATLDLIAEHGVAGATYRTVAAAADVFCDFNNPAAGIFLEVEEELFALGDDFFGHQFSILE